MINDMPRENESRRLFLRKINMKYFIVAGTCLAAFFVGAIIGDFIKGRPAQPMSAFLTTPAESWQADYGDSEKSRLYYNIALLRQNQQKIILMINRHGEALQTLVSDANVPEEKAFIAVPDEPNSM
jgi:hypothetical protein